MADGYLTSKTDLSDSPDEEIILQVTEKKTREIFQTRARVAREPGALSDPQPLTVVRGPHENIREEWYIEIIEQQVSDKKSIDRELLRVCYARVRDGSNVVNTRSDDVKSLLMYFVERGEYESLSEASRSILLEYAAEEYPALLEAFVDIKVEHETEILSTDFQEYTDGK